MRVSNGAAITAIGVLHELVGVGVMSDVVLRIAADGYVGAVELSLERLATFWFFGFGVLLVMLGETIRWIERRALVLPAGLGVGLCALGLGGGLAMPASGFWLVVPIGLHILWAARRATSAR